MTHTSQDNHTIGDLVVRRCSATETCVGIITLIDHRCRASYFIEWLTGDFQGYTQSFARHHVDEWSKNVRQSNK